MLCLLRRTEFRMTGCGEVNSKSMITWLGGVNLTSPVQLGRDPFFVVRVIVIVNVEATLFRILVWRESRL